MDYEVVADVPCELGEGPLWHPLEKKVYWTDIHRKTLYQYDPATGQHAPLDYEGTMVGGFTFQADGSLLLFREGGNVAVWRDGEITKTVLETIPGEENRRFNDVWADPEGRVYCGTLGYKDEPGGFFMLDTDGTVTKLIDVVKCSNGMGMTPDLKGLYYTETFEQTIWLFDYDRATGGLSNKRAFVQIPKENGFPDGMKTDAEGRVWSAHWEGWGVTCFGPDGKIVKQIKVPAKCTTSVCFGGEDLSQMYITSAGGEDRKANGEYAGALIRVDPGGRGVVENLSRVLC